MARDKADQPEQQPPVKYCPVKGCGKKMRAFKRGTGWKYMCEDEARHAQDKLKAKAAGPAQGKGGVRKGTPSPLMGREKQKPVRLKRDWTKLRPRPKDENGGK